MNYRGFVVALTVVFSFIGVVSEAATVGVAVKGYGASAQVGKTKFRSPLGSRAIKYFIPLGGGSCTYGVKKCGMTRDSGKGGGTLSMWMLFNGVSTTGRSQLSVSFEDLDLINANDPNWFLETAQIYRSDGTSLTGLLSSINQLVPTGMLVGNRNTQQLLTMDIGLLPSDKLWLRFDFRVDSQYWARNTPEYMTASVVSVAPVPLPAAGWLLLSALGGLGAVKRARSRKNQA